MSQVLGNLASAYLRLKLEEFAYDAEIDIEIYKFYGHPSDSGLASGGDGKIVIGLIRGWETEDLFRVIDGVLFCSKDIDLIFQVSGADASDIIFQIMEKEMVSMLGETIDVVEASNVIQVNNTTSDDPEDHPPVFLAGQSYSDWGYDISQAVRSMIDELKEDLVNAQRIIGGLEKSEEDMKARIKAIDHNYSWVDQRESIERISPGLWKNIRFSGNKMIASTCNLLIEGPTGQGDLDTMKMNFGSLEVSFDMINMTILARPNTDNIIADGFFHPHVGQDGVICFGELEDQIKSKMLEFDMVGLMTDVHQILNQYGDNPYQTFEIFYQEASRGQ